MTFDAKKYKREYYKINKDLFRNRLFKRKYNLSLQEYQKLFEKQHGLCAICHCPEHIIHSGQVKKLSVDHCHKTGKIRKLLCANCNSALGKLKESVSILKNMIAYIEDHSGK